MNKSTNFSGIPVIKQIIKLIDPFIIYRTAKKHKSDRYYKKFKTYEHLITMIFTVLSGCSSLKEITGIILACEGKINHLGLKDFPKRSTLSDANKKRSSKVFADIYYSILDKYRRYLSDSSIKSPAVKNLCIVDSTTVGLFSDILKGAGRKPIDGKCKGGLKIHTMINALEDVPCLVHMTSAATSDTVFLKKLELKKESFVVFDKGYNDYSQYAKWCLDEIYFVTRQRENAKYQSLEDLDIRDDIDPGIIRDEKIRIFKNGSPIYLRRIAYWYEEHKKVYEFITNNFTLDADKIADIYKNRWQIEVLFKRLKQNFPLKYFLGDNQNAIEIQIWVSLIIQLIMLVVQRKAERKWAYSNMVSVIRYHLMSYIDLFKFLKNPDAGWEILKTKPSLQLQMFSG